MTEPAGEVGGGTWLLISVGGGGLSADKENPTVDYGVESNVIVLPNYNVFQYVEY